MVYFSVKGCLGSFKIVEPRTGIKSIGLTSYTLLTATYMILEILTPGFSKINSPMFERRKNFSFQFSLNKAFLWIFKNPIKMLDLNTPCISGEHTFVILGSKVKCTF
jgi:hypothetical protein